MRPFDPNELADPTPPAFIDEDMGYAGNISSIERDAKKNTAGCIGTMTIIVAIICMIFAGNVFQKQNSLAQQGVVTTGIVSSKYQMRRSQGISYHYEANGKQFFGMKSVGSGTGLRVGQTVQIRYLPSDPTETEVVGYEDHFGGYLVLALVGVPMLLIAIAMANRWNTLNKTALVIENTSDLVNAPEWATRSYRSVPPEARAVSPIDTDSFSENLSIPPAQEHSDDVARRVVATIHLPKPVDVDIELNELPTDRKS